VRFGYVVKLWFWFGFGFELLICQKPIIGHNSLICLLLQLSEGKLNHYLNVYSEFDAAGELDLNRIARQYLKDHQIVITLIARATVD